MHVDVDLAFGDLDIEQGHRVAAVGDQAAVKPAKA